MSIPIKENFKFLKGDVIKHPTTGINLEYLVKSDAVCIALFDENLEKILLVKQYRPGLKTDVFEVVAGLIDENEDPKEAVIRELQEETGYLKEDITNLISMPKPLSISPGYTTEKLYYFAAKLKSNDIKPKETSFDIGEDIQSYWIDVNEVENYLIDSKTLLSLIYFKRKLEV